MQTQTAVVLGASGLTGNLLLQKLLHDNNFSKIKALVRKPLHFSHPKLEILVTDFNNLVDFRNNLGSGDLIFCCIGTTQKKVNGNLDEYRKIDIEIPLHAAQIGKDAGFKGYLIISAAGANTSSLNFYLRLKGEVEKEIALLKYERFHVFRPGLVLGDQSEFRFKELVAKKFIKVFSPLLAGPFRKFRGINADDIAAAMINASKNYTGGMFIHHYDDMMNASRAIYL